MKLFLAAAIVAACAALGLAACSSNASCSASVPTTCPSSAPSYAKDVAPLVQTYCGSCHAAGGQEADTPLTSYTELSARASDVEGEVGSCDMPPSDEAQPTDAERALILDWIVCGAAND
ncbi:MAG TPA: hypothetical protein VGM56_07365 [Byssovorax sp.]|jgi:uncharacterized membrane protein